jgi:AcrR family transcriptional regulator
MTSPARAGTVPGEEANPRRSQRSRTAILQAGYDLLSEVGYRAVTVEAIASRARVGKMTIYRWWGTKASVLLDAFIEHSNVGLDFPAGSLREILLAHVDRFIELYVDTPLGRQLSELLGEAQSDPQLSRDIYQRWFLPRRQPVRASLLAAQERGELRQSVDVDALIDALYGSLQYRRLLRHKPVTTEYAHGVVDMLLRGAALATASDFRPPASPADRPPCAPRWR